MLPARQPLCSQVASRSSIPASTCSTARLNTLPCYQHSPWQQFSAESVSMNQSKVAMAGDSRSLFYAALEDFVQPKHAGSSASQAQLLREADQMPQANDKAPAEQQSCPLCGVEVDTNTDEYIRGTCSQCATKGYHPECVVELMLLKCSKHGWTASKGARCALEKNARSRPAHQFATVCGACPAEGCQGRILGAETIKAQKRIVPLPVLAPRQKNAPKQQPALAGAKQPQPAQQAKQPKAGAGGGAGAAKPKAPELPRVVVVNVGSSSGSMGRSASSIQPKGQQAQQQQAVRDRLGRLLVPSGAKAQSGSGTAALQPSSFAEEQLRAQRVHQEAQRAQQKGPVRALAGVAAGTVGAMASTWATVALRAATAGQETATQEGPGFLGAADLEACGGWPALPGAGPSSGSVGEGRGMEGPGAGDASANAVAGLSPVAASSTGVCSAADPWAELVARARAGMPPPTPAAAACGTEGGEAYSSSRSSSTSVNGITGSSRDGVALPGPPADSISSRGSIISDNVSVLPAFLTVWEQESPAAAPPQRGAVPAEPSAPAPAALAPEPPAATGCYVTPHAGSGSFCMQRSVALADYISGYQAGLAAAMAGLALARQLEDAPSQQAHLSPSMETGAGAAVAAVDAAMGWGDSPKGKAWVAEVGGVGTGAAVQGFPWTASGAAPAFHHHHQQSTELGSSAFQPQQIQLAAKQAEQVEAEFELEDMLAMLCSAG